MYRDTPPTAGVLESPGNPTPIGQAVEAGWTENGVALWRLRIRGVAVPGLWSIIDRQFIPSSNRLRSRIGSERPVRVPFKNTSPLTSPRVNLPEEFLRRWW
jgi:hypothetical protein